MTTLPLPLLRKAVSTTALILVALCPLASPAQPPAPAKSADGLPAVVVKYGDLDLSQRAGLEVLLKRLDYAARTTCAQFDAAELSRRRQYTACIDSAVRGAVIKTEVPALAALYTEKTGRKLEPNLLMTAHR